MITLDDNTKSRFSGLTDSDGKIIVTDDMPEDLKNCIKYLNDNNVSLFSDSDPSAYVEDYEADPFAPGYIDEEDDSSSDSDSDDYEEYEDEDVSDLDNIF